MDPMALDYLAHSYQNRAKVPPSDSGVAGSLGLELPHHPLGLRLLHQQKRAGSPAGRNGRAASDRSQIPHSVL